MKGWLPTQIVEKTKSIELFLVRMRPLVAGVAVQQPSQVLLQVSVVYAWIIQVQGFATEPVGGIDEETHHSL